MKLKKVITLTEEGHGLINLLAYCIMSNHIHLLVKENVVGGTSLYMQRVLNSYAKYFNIRYHRSDPLFTSRFKNALVDDDEYLLHVSRYIHLNPFVAHLIEDPFDYRWSSLENYITDTNQKDCHTALLNSLINTKDYRLFVTDHADYARSLAETQHLLLDY